MKRFTFLLIIVFAFLPLTAQELKVLDCRPVPTVLHGKQLRPDANNVDAAVVKVLLPVPGATFDGNLIGEPEYYGSEYWVWLEGDEAGSGTSMFDIRCPGVATLHVDFTDFGITRLKSKAVYELSLDVPAELRFGRTSGPSDAGGNYFVLKVTPGSNILVRVDGTPAEVADGEVMQFCRYGEHAYSIEAPGYMAENGSFTITKGGDKVIRNVTLRSSKASVTVTAATPGTVISLNGQRKGAGSWSGSLGAGTYQLEATLDGHEPYRTSFDLAESETRTVEIPALTPIYARLDVTCKPSGATITIDGKQAGTTPQVFTELLEGKHKLTVSSPGYQSLTRDVTLSAAQPVMVADALTKQTTVSKKGDGLRTPQHLSLCVSDKDGNIMYFTEDQWKGFSAKEKAFFVPKGVVIKDETDAFLVAMQDVGKGDWDYACRNGAPSRERFELIYKYKDSLNKALKIFGGKELSRKKVYWSSTEYDFSAAWLVYMASGIVGFDLKSNAYRVRAVAPVPEAI